MGLRKVYDVGLQPRLDRFVEQYFSNNCNASEAARACGYAGSSIANVCNSLMRNPYVVKQIRWRHEQIRQRNDVTLDKIIVELSHISFFDIGKIYDTEGRLRPLHTLTQAVRAGIAGVESEELYAGSGEERIAYGMQRKVKITDRVRAMELLAKLLGYVEKFEVGMPGAATGDTTRVIFEDHSGRVTPHEELPPPNLLPNAE
jgi:phage terminase small subunit